MQVQINQTLVGRRTHSDHDLLVNRQSQEVRNVVVFVLKSVIIDFARCILLTDFLHEGKLEIIHDEVFIPRLFLVFFIVSAISDTHLLLNLFQTLVHRYNLLLCNRD